jgi:hypothetical protein
MDCAHIHDRVCACGSYPHCGVFDHFPGLESEEEIVMAARKLIESGTLDEGDRELMAEALNAAS